jgi:hypothetical protein
MFLTYLHQNHPLKYENLLMILLNYTFKNHLDLDHIIFLLRNSTLFNLILA